MFLRIPFEVLLSHCTDDVLEQEPCRKLMVKSKINKVGAVATNQIIILVLRLVTVFVFLGFMDVGSPNNGGVGSR